MGLAKNIKLVPLKSAKANEFIKKHHYSGKVVQNSTLHIGVLWEGRLEGVLSFGNSLDKRKIIGLVEGTGWNEFIELNRMAFSDKLPRNSESRAISIACKLIKKHKPDIKWVISFADACQCGDGTIYRASGFVLTGLKENKQLYQLPRAEDLDVSMCLKNGLTEKDVLWTKRWLKSITKPSTESLPVAHKLSVEDRPSRKMSLQGAPSAHKMSLDGGVRPSSELSEVKNIMRRLTNGGTSADKFFRAIGGTPQVGYQLRYIKFLDESFRGKLTVPEIPFSEIERQGAKMYKGKRADD